MCDVFENRWQKLDILLVMLIDPSAKGILFLQESRITKSAMNFNPDEDKIGRIFYRAIPTFTPCFTPIELLLSIEDVFDNDFSDYVM